MCWTLSKSCRAKGMDIVMISWLHMLQITILLVLRNSLLVPVGLRSVFYLRVTLCWMDQLCSDSVI